MMLMKIGVIGIGDIATKGYLPVTTRIKDVTLYIYTRNKDVLQEVKREYKHVVIVESVNDLIDEKMDAVMIHAATEVHYQFSKQFLELGIPVFVDKPVSMEFKEVEELYHLAKAKNTTFRVGFNRRHSTYINQTKDSDPEIIIYQRNRYDWPGPVQHYIFTDFIHAVDTVLFYLKDDVTLSHVKGLYKDNLMYSLTVTLQTKDKVAHIIMYRDSGKSEEIIELLGRGAKYRITNLDSMIEYKDKHEIHHKQNDWLPTLTKRGFKAMVNEFVTDVRNKEGYMEKDDLAYRSHDVCERIFQAIKKAV